MSITMLFVYAMVGINDMDCVLVGSFTGQNIWHSPSAVRPVYQPHQFTVEHGCHIAQGQWLPHENFRCL